MWLGFGCPCPPVRNDIVTPRHLFYPMFSTNSILSCIISVPSGWHILFSSLVFVFHSFICYFPYLFPSFSTMITNETREEIQTDEIEKRKKSVGQKSRLDDDICLYRSISCQMTSRRFCPFFQSRTRDSIRGFVRLSVRRSS